MTGELPRAPRIARGLLARALPRDVRDSIVGDLEEVYAERCGTIGRTRARLWYWRETISFTARFLRERLRGDAGGVAEMGRGRERGSGGGHGERRFGRGRGGGGISWLDVKLGFRMLVKYPVLSLVGGLAITVAAGIGVAGAEFTADLFTPSLPLEDGKQVVRLIWEGRNENLHDFALWREEMENVTDLGAASSLEMGVVTAAGETGAVSAARITASASGVTRVAPILGRFITEADEREDAPAVVVLGHESWQTLFGGDPAAVGQTVQLSGSPATVIGVMPEGFRFPINQGAWVPLRFDPLRVVPGSGPSVVIFGRLAEWSTLEQATAELTALARTSAPDLPVTEPAPTPQVVRYAELLGGAETEMQLVFYGVRLLFIFLLVVACANVATLVFARAVNREGEIAIRTAMGATRGRIVLQFFAEAVVLVLGSTALALLITRWALGRGTNLFWQVQQQTQPFWWDDGLSTTTLAYAVVLALVGAVMIGVVPALKATNGKVQPKLTRLSSGGGAGLRFGGMWTAVIVFQVALSVAFLPLAVEQGGSAFENPLDGTDFPAGDYLTGEATLDVPVTGASPSEEERAEFLERSRQVFEELKNSAHSQPGVEGVALADWLPGMNHPVAAVEVRGDEVAAPVGGGSRTLRVDLGYLSLMGSEVVTGRSLVPADFSPGARSVVVNERFVENVLGGANAVGAQLRYPGREGEEADVWYEIVGVVSNPVADEFGPGAHASVYAPWTGASSAWLFVKVRTEGVESLAPRMHALAGSVSSSVRLSALATIEDAWGPAHRGERLFGWIFALLAGVTLMLSVAGIYALMSFTVSQRTREIAIRTAIGAEQAHIVVSVFARAFVQLGFGVLVGLTIIAVPMIRGSLAYGARTVILVAMLLLAAGLASCLLPIRRALRIHPSHAMKTG